MKFLFVVVMFVTWDSTANKIEAFHVGRNPYYFTGINGKDIRWPMDGTKITFYKILPNDKQRLEKNEENAFEKQEKNREKTEINYSKELDNNFLKNENFKNKLGVEYWKNGRAAGRHNKQTYTGKCNCTCHSVEKDDEYENNIDDYEIKRDSCRCECLSSKTKLARVLIKPLTSQHNDKYRKINFSSKSEDYPLIEYGGVLKEGDTELLKEGDDGYNTDLNYQNAASSEHNVPLLDEKPQGSFLDYPHNNCYRSSCLRNADCCRMFNICDPSAKVCIDCWWNTSRKKTQKHGMYCTTWKDCCFKHPYCEQKALNKTSSEEDVKNGSSKYKIIVEGRCVGKKPLNHVDIGL